MRVCISTQNPSWGGGVWSQSKFLIDFLKKEGHEPALIFPSNPVKNLFFDDDMPNMGCEYMTRRSFNPFIYPNQLLFSFLMRRRIGGFDIYQSISGPNFEAAPFMISQKKYICWVGTTFRDEWKWVHENTFSRGISPFILGQVNNFSVPLLRRLERKIFMRASKICPVSSYTESRIKEEYKIDDEKITVINNPVDTKKFSPKGMKMGLPKYILTVSRLDKRKDIPTLLRAFSDVLKSNPSLKLIIVGDGPEKSNLIKLAHESGLSGNVEFCGFVDDERMSDYYRSAELFVLSSLQEGFGIVLAEALACGTPVVSTACGGVGDIIEHGKTGLLAKKGDHRDLSEKISEILDSKNFRNRIAKDGMKFVRSKFSYEKIGGQFLDLYERI